MFTFGSLHLDRCIGDDTKAAARQSLNCIKNNKKIWQKCFQYGVWNSYTLQCGIMACGFTKWQHPAM